MDEIKGEIKREILAQRWFERSALEVAPDLIGCTLVRRFADGRMLRGMIV